MKNSDISFKTVSVKNPGGANAATLRPSNALWICLPLTGENGSWWLTRALGQSCEAPFSLNGAVNNQNCRIWSASPPDVLHQQPLHSDYVIAWCEITADFIVGPSFFATPILQGPETFCNEYTVQWILSTVTYSCITGTAMSTDHCLHVRRSNSLHWAQSQRTASC